MQVRWGVGGGVGLIVPVVMIVADGRVACPIDGGATSEIRIDASNNYSRYNPTCYNPTCSLLRQRCLIIGQPPPMVNPGHTPTSAEPGTPGINWGTGTT